MSRKRDFRELMVVNYFEDESRLSVRLELNEYSPRIYKALVSPSGVHVSIQASSMHYCYPRKTVGIMEYESFEVACYASDDSSGFSTIFEVTGDPYFEAYESDGIYAGLPLEKVQELCEILDIIG